MSNLNTEHSPISSTAELAKHLGLSRWTVSRVLNQHPGVKEETRTRVLDAIAALGFQPNQFARGLKGASSNLVGLCFQQLEAPILARKTTILQKHLRAQGYRGVLEMTDGDRHVEATILNHFLSIGVDGIVLVGSTLQEEDSIVEQLLRSGKPVVAIDPVYPLPFPQVLLDRRKAMMRILEHLFGLGHRRFALLGFDSDQLYREYRRAGLVEGAAQLGLDLEADFDSFWLPGFQDQDYGYGAALARKFLEKAAPRPTGLIALNDRIAIGAMRVLQDAGFEIPRHFSVLGFDNIECTGWSAPALTTIDQRSEETMRTAMNILTQAIRQDGEGIPAQHWIEPALIERASTGRSLPQLND
ncbi:MAG: LacI family DNA-binding transcriptional regulator [Opitutales bacterium]|nr:LacI family DNA-binding transcriptional regulator [Opitutales bacterium]